MNEQTVVDILKSSQETMRKHSPAILTDTGIAGMAMVAITVIRTILKTPRMVGDRETEDRKRLTTSEIVETTWKCYIPAATTDIRSAACIIGVSSISARQNTALVTVYIVPEAAPREYKDKTVEAIEPKEEQTIRDVMAEGQLEQAGVPERKFIPTGRGETLRFDSLTNACFRPDYEILRGVGNTLDKRLRDEVKITINDSLEELSLSSCDPVIDDNPGWDADKGWVEFDFNS